MFSLGSAFKQALLFSLLSGSLMAGELRDPMEPYGYLSAGSDARDPAMNSVLDENTLRLSGIFIGPGGNSAVINNRRVYVGEQIDGAQLVTIEPHAVELEQQGDRIKIELLPISVKAPAKALSGGGK
ncbi:MAG: hypothetical protein OQL20_05515 [Sedimenticola sp.]|nr:hypothetical protein [Sedimenticola sp.]